MSSEPAVRVRHVSKEYKLGLTGRTKSLPKILRERIRHPIRGDGTQRERIRALDDVTFDVAPGEVVGVIGANGAGKSTLLKILSRITPPSDGYIEMAGNAGSLLEVGTGFHPELTGIENVYLNGTILGMSKRDIDRQLEEIVEFAGVRKFLDTPVKRYSSGMRVRLAFAVAAHLDPEILIIDEVLSVGDYSFQAKCLDKMRSVASEQGRTVLYVSHNLVTVEHLCPRALLLIDGRLAYDGDTPDTLSKYLYLFPHAKQGLAAGVFDLAAADRSTSTYTQVFKELRFRPNGGTPSNIIKAGDRVRIEIMVEGMEAIPDPVVGVTVGTNAVPALIRMTSGMRPLRGARRRHEYETIVLDLPSLPLMPGEYFVELILKDRSKTVDFVRKAAEFEVVPTDVFGVGYQFANQEGYVIVPWEWEICPTNGHTGAIGAE